MGKLKMKERWAQTCTGIKRICDDPRTEENLFWIGFILFQGIGVWSTTMFPQSGVISKLFKLIFIACMGMKILLYERFSMKEIQAIVFCGICAVGTLYKARYIEPFMWLILIVASKNIPFKKIIQVYLLVTGAICILAFAASMLDVIVNLQFDASKRGIRNSFGIVYPTDFGAHVFFWIISWFYLLGEQIKGYHCAMGLLAGVLVYRFCNARVDAGCIIMVAILFWMGNSIAGKKMGSRRVQGIWKRIWERLGVCVMPVLAILSIALTAIYNEGNSMWSKLDGTLMARLKYGKMAFTDYGLKLFGQHIEMVGNGGSLELKGEYFFLDCSYVNILMTWGIVLLIVVLLLFGYACCKNRKDLYFQYAIALIAVNCVIAHHMMDIAYNPFILAVLAANMMRNNSKGIEKTYEKA